MWKTNLRWFFCLWLAPNLWGGCGSPIPVMLDVPAEMLTDYGSEAIVGSDLEVLSDFVANADAFDAQRPMDTVDVTIDLEQIGDVGDHVDGWIEETVDVVLCVDDASCDDGDPCTDDRCIGTVGCVHEFVDFVECDDGDPCTGADHCIQGKCEAVALGCDCLLDADCNVLEDGDLCNGTLLCDLLSLPYRCVVDSQTVVSCLEPPGENEFCLQAVCEPSSGECAVAPANEGVLCDDGDACVVDSHCLDGVCAGGTELNCNDGNPCTDDICKPSVGCVSQYNVIPCDDGDMCSSGDTCSEGICQAVSQLNCDDGNPCTANGCESAVGCTSSDLEDGMVCGEVGNWHCTQGQCICPQVCMGKACGPDGCGGVCGQCPPGASCKAGECVEFWQPLSLGSRHTCALKQDGVWCWGENDLGQLGDGTTVSRAVPGEVLGLSGTVVVASGGAFTCALGETGVVSCWGSNSKGQLGDGTQVDRLDPGPVSGLAGVTRLSASVYHACALKSDGTVWCWGYNSAGQLGNGTKVDTSEPVPVQGITDAVGLATAFWHTCALLVGGTVRCWGSNSLGQLGDGSQDDSLAPVQVVELQGVVTLAAGKAKTCALKEDGSVACWGQPGLAEIGSKWENWTTVPVLVESLGYDNVALGAASARACSVKADGELWCWGSNSYGGIGNGTQGFVNVPVKVDGVSGVSAVHCGTDHTCAMNSDGALACWGLNSRGRLGDGDGGVYSTPQQVLDPGDATGISAGRFYTCASKADDSIWCWGENEYGQLGDGSKNAAKSPTKVLLESAAKGFEAAYNHACAISDENMAYCWGSNHWGKLGNDAAGVSSSIPVLTGGPMEQVGAGEMHTCALMTYGEVICWGSNAAGELGNGVWGNGETGWGKAVGLSDVTDISATGLHNCAVAGDEHVWCWGANNLGQSGTTEVPVQPVPAEVQGLVGVVSVAAGVSHSCAVREDGGVSCWGNNESGQLGDGGAGGGPLPVEALGLEDTEAVCAGGEHTCAVDSVGLVRCWGGNTQGQLGDGTTDQKSVPTPAEGVAGAIAIGCGRWHSCAVIEDGSAMCWGNNQRGQLGFGNAWALAPQAVIGFPEM